MIGAGINQTFENLLLAKGVLAKASIDDLADYPWPQGGDPGPQPLDVDRRPQTLEPARHHLGLGTTDVGLDRQDEGRQRLGACRALPRGLGQHQRDGARRARPSGRGRCCCPPH